MERTVTSISGTAAFGRSAVSRVMLRLALAAAILVAVAARADGAQAIIEGVPDYCQEHFEGSNDCAPVACANVLGYWDSHGRPDMIDGSSDFATNAAGVTALVDRLKLRMFWTPAGTEIDLISRGITNTAADRGYFFESRNQYRASWADFTGEIDAHRPLVFTISHSKFGGYHSTAGIGYDDTDGTRRVILHDVWLPTGHLHLNFDECLGPVIATAVPKVYVDDDAPHDPAPGDPEISDPREDGSEDHPYDSIQKGLENGGDGVIIVVRSGLYRGRGNRDLDFMGKASVLCGEGGPTSCIIRCDGSEDEPHRAFCFNGQPAGIVQNFTITGGYADEGGAVYSRGSAPVFRNCIFSGNRALRGGAFYGDSSRAELINCTLADNSAGHSGGAVYSTGSGPTIADCIAWGNSPDQLYGEIGPVSYSVVQGGWDGVGNVDGDPLFAAPPADYHVMSVFGRWQPESGAWLYDAATGAGVDAGDPAAACPLEPDPGNGQGRVNAGAYGNTPEASRNAHWWSVPGDVNDDCVVNVLDLIFVRNHLTWQNSGGGMWKADVNGDGCVSILDLIFVRNRMGTACK